MSIDENKNYKTLYYDILKNHNILLKTNFSFQENELISVKNANKMQINLLS